MTRTRLLHLLILQAQTNGFNFRDWFAANSGIPWTGTAKAVEWLSGGERASILLFSHRFAEAFWQKGKRVTFLVPAQTFQRIAADGSTKTVVRRAHLRQSSRWNVWQFHLREMAAAPKPLRYIRRYLMVDEAVTEALASTSPTSDVNEPSEG